MFKALDEFVKVTRYHRKHAIRALRRMTGRGAVPARRSRVYDEAVRCALTILWVPMTPLKAIALLSTLQSADIVLPTTDGREIRLRRITEPTTEQKSVLRQLGISLPEHLHLHRECSADSAIA